jgi:hypothetical protein
VIAVEATTWHPLLSVTVTLKGPADNPFTANPLPPELQEREYGGIPLETVTAALPSLPPLHDTFCTELKITVGAPGACIVAVAVPVHPLASITVTE